MRLTTCLGICVIGLTALVATVRGEEEEKYPNDHLLMEPSDLKMQTSSLVIVDVRDKASYDAGHIPGAISAPHADWKDAFAKSNDPDVWSERIGAIGIDGQKPVVIYDDAAGNDAARVWFILQYFGVKDVRLLNGFWKGWQAADFPTTTKVTAPTTVEFTAKPNEKLRATKDEVLGQISEASPSHQILDARTLAEHLGTNKLSNPRGGRLPGACHLDWVEVIDTKETQRFKPAAELRQLFKEAKINIHQPIVTHCQSGGRSAVMMFTLNLLGSKEVANYYGSFGEWSKDPDAPVVSEEEAAPTPVTDEP